MDLLLYKFIAALIIFLTALLAGLLPTLTPISTRSRPYFILGDYIARGIFLGAAIFHMLPDAIEEFSIIDMVHSYPYAIMICTSGFILLWGFERAIHALSKNNNPASFIAYLLAIILSIHSIIAGAALGINTNLAGVLVIFFAIVAHKAFASLALGIKLRYANIKQQHMLITIILFSCMTPIGILIGAELHYFIHHERLSEAIFNAFAAGTFLYIATLHHHTEKHLNGTVYTSKNFVALLFGISIMAILAIWI